MIFEAQSWMQSQVGRQGGREAGRQGDREVKRQGSREAGRQGRDGRGNRAPHEDDKGKEGKKWRRLELGIKER